MSLKKESFGVAFSLSVSLSHFSFVETCERKKTRTSTSLVQRISLTEYSIVLSEDQVG